MDSSSPSATSANAEAQPGANEQKPKIFTLPSFTKLWDKKKPQPNFPPSTWDVSKNTPGTATTSTLPSTGLHPDVANTGSSYIGTIGKGNATTALSEEEPVKASLVEDAPDDAAASLTLAQRIRDLIPSHDASNKDTTIPVYPPQSTESHSVPPPRPAWIDAGIAQLLESAEFMNGTISQGRKSVWDVLERLRAPKEAEKDTSMDHKSPGTEVDEIESDSDADSSVMLYAPLVPDNDSKVELAERETVKTDAQGNLIEVIRDRPAHPIKEAQPSANDGAKMERRRTWWPFGAQKGKEKAQETAKLARSQSFEENSLRQTEITIEPQGIPANDSHPTETVIQSLKRRVSQKLQEHSVWVPSATKISFQATWWGYRIYLPPPIMLVLDDKSLAAAKRAAMITTALQWLINKIPMMAVPPQLKPGLLLAKRFLPYVGYVGGAIAWSWSTVKGYDKGNGVVMSATWVLPLAVLPSTWDVSKYPKAAPAGAPSQ